LTPSNNSNSNHLKARVKVTPKKENKVKVRSQTAKVAAKKIRKTPREIAPKAMNLQLKMRAKLRVRASPMTMILREPKKKAAIYAHVS
jgi:hypothetical protein